MKTDDGYEFVVDGVTYRVGMTGQVVKVEEDGTETTLDFDEGQALYDQHLASEE